MASARADTSMGGLYLQGTGKMPACWPQTARGEKSAGFFQKVIFLLQTADFFFLFLHLLAELKKLLVKRHGALRGL